MNEFYIAIDFFGWAQGATLEEAIAKREDDSGKAYEMNVWKIKGDPKMLYSISWFIPQIEGAEWVWHRSESKTGGWDIIDDIKNEVVVLTERNRYSLPK